VSEDVFESWKNVRFVVANNVYVESENIILVLTDMAYWIDHYHELEEWCQEHQGQAVGMTVELPDKATFTLFTLRWL
jgi:hypothetical protein